MIYKRKVYCLQSRKWYMYIECVMLYMRNRDLYRISVATLYIYIIERDGNKMCTVHKYTYMYI